MPGEFRGPSSDDEAIRWATERTKNDADLLHGRAKYQMDSPREDGEKRPVLVPTPQQIEEMREAMEAELRAPSLARELWEEFKDMSDDRFYHSSIWPRALEGARLCMKSGMEQEARQLYNRVALLYERDFDELIALHGNERHAKRAAGEWLALLEEFSDPDALEQVKAKVEEKLSHTVFDSPE